MVMKRIICLANSRKRAEHCVAGVEILDGGQRLGGWIRPVGSGHEQALLTIEQLYADGTSAQVLDVLDVHLTRPQPNGCQVENWQVDNTQRWVKSHEVDRQRLVNAMQPPATLFQNGSHTSAGLNDQILTEEADRHGGSLLLVHVPQVAIHVFDHWGRRKCQGRFEYNGTHYWITVTDPVVEAEFMPQGEAVHNLGPCMLSVSLSSPLVKTVGGDNRSFRFKLIAAVIRLT